MPLKLTEKEFVKINIDLISSIKHIKKDNYLRITNQSSEEDKKNFNKCYELRKAVWHEVATFENYFLKIDYEVLIDTKFEINEKYKKQFQYLKKFDNLKRLNRRKLNKIKNLIDLETLITIKNYNQTQFLNYINTF